METENVSKESEVKENQEVTSVPVRSETVSEKQPEDLPVNSKNESVDNLESAIKDAIQKIQHCDEQMQAWENRKKKLQNKMAQTLENIKGQFGAAAVESTPKKPTKTRMDKNATVSEMIRSLLEKRGPTRTKDIRKFLLDHNKKTNPGVALSRMVQTGELKHTERGVYTLA